jgi:beta-glucuronidase
MKNKVIYLSFLIFLFSLIYDSGYQGCFSQDSSECVNKGWAVLGKRDFEQVYEITDACIQEFSQEADMTARKLSGFPSKGEESAFEAMNNVATCYFIKGEALMRDGKTEEAKSIFREVSARYPWAQAFDPRGWYWSIKEKADITLNKLETGKVVEDDVQEEGPITRVELYDEGAEFPVDYSKYGTFVGLGTRNYAYTINDPIGLSKAVGEGIYPNTTSIKFDPVYVKIKKNLAKVDHWQVLNSRDLNTAFYKWNLAPEPAGVRQFHIAEILERSGLTKSAIKAYYAIVINFPNSYGWTYWHTPWYVGKVALYRVKYLIKHHPELGLKLEDARIQVVNGYDNDIRNDVYVVNPGRLTTVPFWDRKSAPKCDGPKRKLGNVVANQGNEIKLIKYESGDWQMLVGGKPFMIKAITYGPTAVGESPDDGSMQNWITQDLNANGLIDAPYESWVDSNKNGVQDPEEKVIGDFALMKEMGVNAIRLYHQPFDLDKKILRQMYKKYGIYILLGDFLGKYALGSEADWESGTDYDNLQHQDSMLKSIEKMVLEFRDEPYVLVWLIGNENVYGLGCNADKKPESFFKFANTAAKFIKELDPKRRPVAIVSGDCLYLDVFAKNCPDVDIFGTNVYRGGYGFLDLWDEIKRVADKPAMITEYGAPSYARGYSQEEGQDYQADYHRSCWEDIVCNSIGYGAGNAIGGIVFEWLDEWWKAYEPAYHDKKGLFSGPFLDGYMHEEWLGICSQGDGSKSPYLRQLKKTYYTYKGLWNEKSKSEAENN